MNNIQEVDTNRKQFFKQCLKNAPIKTIFYFHVYLKGIKKPILYTATIYPQKGENELTAWDRVEKVSKIAYVNVEKIEFTGMKEN